jgi:hypothetical protein
VRAPGAGRRSARGVEIGDGRLQQGGIVLELTDAEIASAAEQPAHLSGDMAVIDTERACGSRPADGANAALLLQQHVVISQRHAVAGLEPRPAARGRTIVAPPRPLFRILRRSPPPRCVNLVPACPGEAENVHAQPSALVRMASRTGDAGAGGHGRSKLLNARRRTAGPSNIRRDAPGGSSAGSGTACPSAAASRGRRTTAGVTNWFARALSGEVGTGSPQKARQKQGI